MTTAYRIVDEPAPSALSKATVNPLFPLLGLMLGGAWLAWPWFAFNAFALGSPKRWGDLGLSAFGLLGSGALLLIIVLVAGAAGFDASGVRYLLVALMVFKLAVAYALWLRQSEPFELHQHFEQPVFNGLPVVAVAFLFRAKVLAAFEGGLLLIVLS